MLPSIFFCQVIFLYDRLGFLFSFHANFPRILGLIFCKCIEAMKFAFLQHFLKMIFTVKLSNNMESLSQLILGTSNTISGRSNVIFTKNIKLFRQFQAKSYLVKIVLNDFIPLHHKMQKIKQMSSKCFGKNQRRLISIKTKTLRVSNSIIQGYSKFLFTKNFDISNINHGA